VRREFSTNSSDENVEIEGLTFPPWVSGLKKDEKFSLKDLLLKSNLSTLTGDPVTSKQKETDSIVFDEDDIKILFGVGLKRPKLGSDQDYVD